jgi:hypothetical protein
MTTLRTQIEALYGSGKISSKIVLDQAVMAGVDVDDEAASQEWRDRMIEAAREALEAAETKAELMNAIQLHVGWLRWLAPDCLADLKKVAEARQF